MALIGYTREPERQTRVDCGIIERRLPGLSAPDLPALCTLPSLHSRCAEAPRAVSRVTSFAPSIARGAEHFT